MLFVEGTRAGGDEPRHANFPPVGGVGIQRLGENHHAGSGFVRLPVHVAVADIKGRRAIVARISDRVNRLTVRRRRSDPQGISNIICLHHRLDPSHGAAESADRIVP